MQKNFGFFEFMVCPHGQGRRGVEPVRTFFGQGGRKGVVFSRFCADVVYGRPQTIFVPIFTYDHESLVMTERIRSQVQASEMRFYERLKKLSYLTKCVELKFENI